MKKAVLLIMATLAGCTDAEYSQYASYGEAANIECYSGGQAYYRGRSTGKIHTEAHSDGWYFQEQGSNHLVRVSGSCMIRQKTGSTPLPAIESTCCGEIK